MRLLYSQFGHSKQTHRFWQDIINIPLPGIKIIYELGFEVSCATFLVSQIYKKSWVKRKLQQSGVLISYRRLDIDRCLTFDQPTKITAVRLHDEIDSQTYGQIVSSASLISTQGCGCISLWLMRKRQKWPSFEVIYWPFLTSACPVNWSGALDLLMSQW